MSSQPLSVGIKTRKQSHAYRFGNAEIFNLWPVINYFSNECKPGCYWLSTGSNDIIGEMLTHADEVTYHRLLPCCREDHSTQR